MTCYVEVGLVPTASAAATTAAGATIATASATTAATTTTEVATRTFFARTGFIDGERTAVEFFAIELRDGSVGFFLRSHFHERETAGLVGEFVHDQFAFSDRTGLFEQVEDIAFGGIERQVTYK